MLPLWDQSDLQGYYFTGRFNPFFVKLTGFQKLSVTTVIATLFLIFVGGLVRAAGAGLGCPDWPTCFGLWIPPTSAEALPAIYDKSQFNVLHTWLEYINRLTGVVIGLLITATFLFSFRYWRTDRVITLSAGLAFVLVLFQGWLGGQVVQSGLSEGLITLHMMLAMVIVTILLFTAFRSTGRDMHLLVPSDKVRALLLSVTAILFVFMLIQMVLGTQVREMVDLIKNAPVPPPREEWLHQLEGWLYAVHRSFSWLILITGSGLFWFTYKQVSDRRMRRISFGILALILIQMFIGISLEWSGMAGLFQVTHLLVSALLICALVLYMLMIWFSHPSAG